MADGEFVIIGAQLTDEQSKRALERLLSWSEELGVSWAHKKYDQCNDIDLKIFAYCESMLDMGLVTVIECENMKRYWTMTRPERIKEEYTRDE